MILGTGDVNLRKHFPQDSTIQSIRLQDKWAQTIMIRLLWSLGRRDIFYPLKPQRSRLWGWGENNRHFVLVHTIALRLVNHMEGKGTQEVHCYCNLAWPSWLSHSCQIRIHLVVPQWFSWELPLEQDYHQIACHSDDMLAFNICNLTAAHV